MSDTTETETDTTDEPTKAELHDRVQQLESTVEKLMPSRRDALRMGVAGLAGAAGLSATTQTADASTGSAGQIGDVNNRPDVFADTVDTNNLTGVSTGDRQGCRVFLSSSQGISSGRVKIQFDSAVYDSNNNFDTSTHAWTCPKDGLYAVNLEARFVGGGNNQDRRVLIGTATNSAPNNEGAFFRNGSSDSGDGPSVSTINKYSSGDTIAGYVQNVAGSDTLDGGSDSSSTFLEVAFLGSL